VIGDPLDPTFAEFIPEPNVINPDDGVVSVGHDKGQPAIPGPAMTVPPGIEATVAAPEMAVERLRVAVPPLVAEAPEM
jgi:hypothetical protein